MLLPSGADAAAARPAALTEQRQLVTLPESDHAAAREAARASTEIITTEREKLRKLLGA